MEKDFDTWNKIKKETERKTCDFGIHEREIWWVSFGVNVGVEIDGKNKNFERPAIILRKFNRDMVWVLPTTQKAKDLRFHERFTFDGTDYFAALTQLRTVSTKRFLRKIGMVSVLDFERIQERIIGFLRTNENPHKGGFSRRPKP